MYCGKEQLGRQQVFILAGGGVRSRGAKSHGIYRARESLSEPGVTLRQSEEAGLAAQTVFANRASYQPTPLVRSRLQVRRAPALFFSAEKRWRNSAPQMLRFASRLRIPRFGPRLFLRKKLEFFGGNAQRGLLFCWCASTLATLGQLSSALLSSAGTIEALGSNPCSSLQHPHYQVGFAGQVLGLDHTAH